MNRIWKGMKLNQFMGVTSWPVVLVTKFSFRLGRNSVRRRRYRAKNIRIVVGRRMQIASLLNTHPKSGRRHCTTSTKWDSVLEFVWRYNWWYLWKSQQVDDWIQKYLYRSVAPFLRQPVTLALPCHSLGNEWTFKGNPAWVMAVNHSSMCTHKIDEGRVLNSSLE